MTRLAIRAGRTFAAIAGAACVAACSASDEAAAPSTPTALETETGIAWNVVSDPTTKTLSFAEPRGPGPLMLTGGRSPTEAALVFLESHATSFSLSTPRTQLVPEAEGTTALSLRYASFIVADDRGAVTATRLTVHFDADGRVAFLAGRHAAASTSVAARSFVAGSDTRARARSFRFDGSGKGVHFYAAPPLQDLADEKHFEVSAGAAGGFVMKRAGAPGTTALSCTDAEGPVTSPVLDVWDATGDDPGAAVDAYYYAGKALEFYRTVLGRASYDDADGPLALSVHGPPGTAGYGGGLISLPIPPTDWPSPRLSYAGAFDVIAHELHHAVTENTLRLGDAEPNDTSSNSATLNEAISDVFGAFAEHWLRPGPANLTMGEDVAAPGYPPTRDMAHPSRCLDVGCTDDCAHRACPDHLSKLDPLTDVHRNTGIATNAWALMTVGGANDTSGAHVDNPIGWDLSLKLWYALVVSRAIPQNARFEDLALATVALARHASGVTIDVSPVACAWVAVGVIDADRAASFWDVHCSGGGS